MAKLSEKYEAIIVFSLKKTEDEIKALTAKFADLIKANGTLTNICLLYTSPSPRDAHEYRMPSSA